jgi:hypothetical protein
MPRGNLSKIVIKLLIIVKKKKKKTTNLENVVNISAIKEFGL